MPEFNKNTFQNIGHASIVGIFGIFCYIAVDFQDHKEGHANNDLISAVELTEVKNSLTIEVTRIDAKVEDLEDILLRIEKRMQAIQNEFVDLQFILVQKGVINIP